MSMHVNSRLSILLGERMKRISQVSRDTGISRTTLTRLFYRKSEAISFDVLGRLCEYLGCSISDLLDLRNESEVE